MPDFSLPTYDEPRKWIKSCRDHKVDWDAIMLARKADDEALAQFLSSQEEINFWPSLSVDDWKAIVMLQKSAEENAKSIELKKGFALIHNADEVNAVTIPEDQASSWQLYKKKLIADGFKKETVDEIESTTLKILKRLNSNTTETGPVKGLVIGNVQSGKTANMAALMAMAADWGWNMFIVLSGTIENLRIQTQSRLFNDLNQQGTIFWRSLEHLSKSVDISQRAQSLHFDANSKERYFTVCLKNSSRLSKLIQWAQVDTNKQKQMKILVIDDEADQAGINTGNIDIEERKKINKLICALVNGQNEKSEPVSTSYRAMNYIGYTATPYANILNEGSKESLYPRNFITTLAVSKEYFGPQQIFGYNSENEDTYFEGMDIVRTINADELDTIKDIHDGYSTETPDSLIDAVCWFLCGVACMRIWGYKKPVSMLVHTSQKTAHHSNIAAVINKWLSNPEHEVIMSRVREVWEKEATQFTLEKFREQYPGYDRPDSSINNYPSFEEIREQVNIILDAGVSHIQLGDDGDLTYHQGIHLCIDNCTNTGISSDGMHVRLAYPEPSRMPSPAPAFIVVGGATLSRGLTIEGLISTYFLRSVGQADTLMQMGRWFGYRKTYELLPRIWLTPKTKAQFEFLAELDQELRDEIQYMDVNGRSPEEYGPKVKNSPKVSFIRITSKNKMQSATESTMDYSGASNQTYLFDCNEDSLNQNIVLTERFLASLGTVWPKSGKEFYNRNAVIWKNIPFDKIRKYIEKFQFQQRLRVFNDTKPLLDWVKKMTEQNKLGTWNVVVSGKSDAANGTWVLPDGLSVNKIKRTRKIPKNEAERSILNIGALRDPRDLFADIDLDMISDLEIRDEVTKYIKSGESKAATAYRDKAGMETTPQLLIYRVDKNSSVNGGAGKTRENLEAPADLIGLCMYIPGGRIGTSYASTISIKMKNDIFDGDADMEGTDEN